jgi:hypothetical protein
LREAAATNLFGLNGRICDAEEEERYPTAKYGAFTAASE